MTENPENHPADPELARAFATGPETTEPELTAGTEVAEVEVAVDEPGEDVPAGTGSRLKQTLALRTPEELRPAIEAILMVVDEPVADNVLAQILERPTGEVTAVLEGLAAEYREQERGFDLRRAAGGWRFYTRSEFAPYVERFVLDGQQARLTQAALETLAVIAYKQPVTRSRISAIRGVAVDGVIRTLLTRGLIEECGAEPDTGAHLYRTTLLFLEKLGLDTLGELPPLAPLLPDLDSLDDVISPSA
ncbi:MAG: segregation and condensation protein [Cryptosporangiaceae bacterium]|nr:segregation and condensation protein [Cryptosporangiaceae bacterium]